jgi:branched-chain amino acid transport system permease protein
VSINLLMDLSIIAEAFVVVVIGGMGSIPGAFVAALLIGELNAFGVLVLPQATIVLAFVVMAVVLIIRPYGLFGKAEAAAHAAGQVEAPIRPASPLMKGIALATLAFLLALPLLFDSFAVVLADRHPDLRPVCRQPALHHGQWRHGLVRSCRLFWPRLPMARRSW